MIALRKIHTSVFNESCGVEAARLGEKGFATRFICARTGLTPGQVAYRLNLAGVSRADFRNGLTATARSIAAERASKQLIRRLDRLTESIDRLSHR